MDGAEEIQVWVERPEVLDRMSFDSSFIKEKNIYIYVHCITMVYYKIYNFSVVL